MLIPSFEIRNQSKIYAVTLNILNLKKLIGKKLFFLQGSEY